MAQTEPSTQFDITHEDVAPKGDSTEMDDPDRMWKRFLYNELLTFPP